MLIRYGLPALSAVMLAFAAVQLAMAQQKPPPTAPPVEPAKSPYATQLAGAGLVEPMSENISVGSQLAGGVDRVFVQVGQTVRTGTPLFALDDRQLKAELASREAARANAQATLDKLEAGPRPEEVPPAEAKVAEADAVLREQTVLYERYRRLATTNAITEDELVRREVGLETAKAQVAKAKADLSLLKAGAWKYDRAIAAAGVSQAAALVDQTKTELDRLTARAPRGRADEPSPADGAFEVLQVNVRPGEFVGAAAGQALVVLGHLGRLHVRVDVDENDIARFRPGLPGVAKPRGSPDREYALAFVRVEPYVVPKKSLTGGNTERVDTRVLQVIYAIREGGQPLYVGQQMDVFLDTGGK